MWGEGAEASKGEPRSKALTQRGLPVKMESDLFQASEHRLEQPVPVL